MDTEAGGDAVGNALAVVETEVNSGMAEARVYAILRSMIDEIKKTHPEVRDTDVRSCFTAELDPVWRESFGHTIDQWQFS